MNRGTVLLTRSDVAALLGMPECIDAVEKAFRVHAVGDVAAAARVYERAVERGRGASIRLTD